MSHTDEDITRLFDRAFAEEAPGDDLWQVTRVAMRRKVRARRAMVAASVAVFAALAVTVPQVLLGQRATSEVEFYERPPGEEEPADEPQVPSPESPVRLTPRPPADDSEPAPPAPDRPPSPAPAPTPAPAPPASERSEPAPQAPAGELTDWYTVHLHEEIEPGARYFSAWQAMDALVAAMYFADGARVSHGVSDAQESSAKGWIDVTGAGDDSIAGEEIRVQLRRDDGGWFVDPVGEARSRCSRGVDVTDRSRCV